MRKAALEAIQPAAKPARRRDHLSLILFVGDDFSNFSLDVVRLGWLASEPGKSGASSLDVSSFDEVSGRVWQQHETATEDESPGELNGNGNAVLASVSSVLGGIDDACCEQETDCDAELVASDQSTSDPLGALGRDLAPSQIKATKILTISLM